MNIEEGMEGGGVEAVWLTTIYITRFCASAGLSSS
jgi:hypothetical protein